MVWEVGLRHVVVPLGRITPEPLDDHPAAKRSGNRACGRRSGQDTFLNIVASIISAIRKTNRDARPQLNRLGWATGRRTMTASVCSGATAAEPACRVLESGPSTAASSR